VESGRSPQPPRRGTRIHHPPSSYVPFFVFVSTLIIVVLVIAWLVGRLLGMVPGASSPTPLPPATVALLAQPTATTPPGKGPPRRIGVVPRRQPTMSPVLFAHGHDGQGNPRDVAVAFARATPRIYAFATLHSVSGGAPVRFVWVYGLRRVVLADTVEHVGEPAYSAHRFSSYAYPDEGAFASGPYTVTVTLAGKPVARSSFQVRGP